MGQAIAVRADFTAGEVRRCAKRAKDAAQARRLSTPEEECIGSPQQRYINDIGKKASEARAFASVKHQVSVC